MTTLADLADPFAIGANTANPKDALADAHRINDDTRPGWSHTKCRPFAHRVIDGLLTRTDLTTDILDDIVSNWIGEPGSYPTRRLYVRVQFAHLLSHHARETLDDAHMALTVLDQHPTPADFTDLLLTQEPPSLEVAPADEDKIDFTDYGNRIRNALGEDAITAFYAAMNPTERMAFVDHPAFPSHMLDDILAEAKNRSLPVSRREDILMKIAYAPLTSAQCLTFVKAVAGFKRDDRNLMNFNLIHTLVHSPHSDTDRYLAMIGTGDRLVIETVFAAITQRKVSRVRPVLAALRVGFTRAVHLLRWRTEMPQDLIMSNLRLLEAGGDLAGPLDGDSIARYALDFARHATTTEVLERAFSLYHRHAQTLNSKIVPKAMSVRTFANEAMDQSSPLVHTWMSGHRDPGVRAVWVEDHMVSPMQAHLAAQDPSHIVRVAVVKHDLTGPETLEVLAADPHALVRVAVVKHASTSVETRTALATDLSPLVRAAVAASEGVDAEVLTVLANDPDPEVREAAAKRFLDLLA